MKGQNTHGIDLQTIIPEWISAAQSVMKEGIYGGAFVRQPPEAAASNGENEAAPSSLDDWIRLFETGLELQSNALQLTESQSMLVLPQQLLQLGVSGASQFHHQWGEQLQRFQIETGEAPDPIQRGAGAFKEWMSWHEKEARQLLSVPPVGIARNYQQDLNQTIDTFNHLQTDLADFIFMLCQPVEHAFKVLRKDIDPPQTTADLEKTYGIWVKALEEQYQSLFQSSEYIQCLARTIESLNAFTGARNKMLEDILRTLPIPNNSDMDELYKEIYTLKKRVRQLEKKITLTPPIETEEAHR